MPDIFETIRDTVPIHDLLDRAGVRYISRTKNCKVSCPFHGADNRKSGFVYVDTNSFHCFTCNQSWDQTAFWAQANEWWKTNDKGENVLDMGKAIASLKELYNIDLDRPAWEQTFQKLKGEIAPTSGYGGFEDQDRQQVSHYYQWKVLQRVAHLPKEERSDIWDSVRDLWDELEDIDLSSDGWKRDLNLWRDRAKLIV